ncbi:MAG: arginine--tRNA ligase [Actinomycetota bacterium]|nr:arginine--tRNA ligase [Actinomycetota bacterium]
MIRDELATAARAALVALEVDPLPDVVEISRPNQREHGDFMTNVALVVAKRAGRKPRDLGQELADNLRDAQLPHVADIEIAGPGFINFRLAPTWLHDVVRDVITQGTDDYARLDLGTGHGVNIEFVSANPTGPLHAGGGRWGAYGDSLARIMRRAGYDAHREYYINDRGTQVQLFGASLVAAKNGEPTPEDGYQGQYITDWAAEMPADADPAEWGLERSLADVRDSLAAMQVSFDTWSSERALVATGAMEATLAELREHGHVYEADGATWLRTSDFGDDKDRVLIRSDGEPTYFLPDIAYHRDKFSRGELIIDVLGADHHGYVPRMKAALRALGHAPEEYEAIIGQNVKLVRDGAEVKISKRAGTMIEIRDLVDEVGPDVARFAFLLQSIDTTQTIDIDLLKAQASENPVFYVQYAHARIHSIAKEQASRGVERLPFDQVDLGPLTHEREIELMRQLSILSEVVEQAAADRAPHKVTTWVRDLASAFHGFYRDCPILRTDVPNDVRQARLWLVEATRIGLAIGLDLLGVRAPESM